eukprot:TRINITY_DN1924_c0_g1_i2.p1 TRINITY_DN1924_c0_g1~~TRINITY_DN1924_c0_g1_i2.p1  ORF type:complete len:367 (+),score=50.36 TRINITY_DN1924_c0_g1_i2:104-1102(+)
MAAADPSVTFLCLLHFLAICISEAVQVQHRVVPYAFRVAVESLRTRNLMRKKGGATLDHECLAPGKLKFVHVMKTGGLSVDGYLWCRCEHEGCSTSHHEGADFIAGDTFCSTPSVCTSHLPSYRMIEQCGDFTSARVFTVLREPVSRVVSFYNYMRSPRPEDGFPGYSPYKENNLTTILRAWGETDLDLDQPKDPHSGGCTVCAGQLSNAMVLRHFASPDSMEARETWVKKAGVIQPPNAEAMVFQLEEAKKVIAGMDAIFVDIGSFKEAFERNDLLLPGGGQTMSACDVPTANPTASKIDPVEEDISLIRQLNWADVELYNYALTLPTLRV